MYSKNTFRAVQSDGYNNVNIQRTLNLLENLFKCFESPLIDLKAKYSILGALELMVNLYKYQEEENDKF